MERGGERWWRRDGAWQAGASVLAAGCAAGALGAALLGGGPSGSLILHALALAGLAAALHQARRATAWSEKVSAEIDAFSARLIGLESRLAAAGDRTAAPALRSSVAEVTGEIALLGNLVRDLAVTVSAQDRELADLRAGFERVAEDLAARPADAAGWDARDSAPQARAPQAWEPDAGTSDARAPDAWLAEARLPESPPAEAWAPVPEPRPRPVLVEAPAPRVEAPPAPAPSPLAVARPEAAEAADTRRIAAIVEAFEADRIELHLQPVVSLPQRKVRIYEALARLRLADDTVMVPAEFLGLVERVGLAGELDRRVIARASVVARHLLARGSEAIVSCNVSPRSLAEPGFLRSVGRVVDAYPDVAGRLVLELSQRCWRTLDAERAGALAVLRDRGVPFALDRATDLRLDALALADRGVRYLKLPADLILRPDPSRGPDIAPGDLAAALARAGIRLVAERVEREEDVPDLIDLDVPLAQGFAFAPPRAVRSDVVAAPSPEPPPAPAPPRLPAFAPPPNALAAPTAASEERLPYRAFLRRAG